MALSRTYRFSPYEAPINNGVNVNFDDIEKAITRRTLHVDEYGAIGDGSTDDATPFQDALDAANTSGGGLVMAGPGKTYYMTVAPVIKDWTILDLQGSTLNITLGSGNIYGVRLNSYCGIQNGTVNITSTGSPSSQLIFHAAISLGIHNNSGDTVASPSAYQTIHHWFVKNMKLSTTRDNTPVIQGMGGLHHGLIENIRVDDNTHCSGIHFDWGNVGTVSTSDVPQGKIDYLAGNMYTTHPNHIHIRNVEFGSLSYAFSAPDLGTRAIRLSACYDIYVDGVHIEKATYAAINHVGGDIGFEFAQSHIRPYAYRNIRFNNITCRQSRQAVYLDTYADNVALAVGSGYAPITYLVYPGDVVVNGLVSNGDGASGDDGFRIEFADGVYINDCVVTNHIWGLVVNEDCRNIFVRGGKYFRNRKDGILIDDDSDIQDIFIENVQSYQNGVDGAYSNPAGIQILEGDGVKVINCVLGVAGEDTQSFGIRVNANASYVSLLDNIVRGIKTNGTGYAIGTSTDMNVLLAYRNNRMSVAGTVYSGLIFCP